MVSVGASLVALELSPNWPEGRACYVEALGTTVALSPLSSEFLARLGRAPGLPLEAVIQDLSGDLAADEGVDVMAAEAAVRGVVDQLQRLGIVRGLR